ncbi:Nucleotide-binding universal stress protein, UspA family [Roseovarius marisflavi]|uniref:Nucleotide-binding universal stress protein, UspA family n=1 Tax=Roseovarius marisflavi TaxID=1054996 RepID=A0A1M6Z6V2_9RHOB|nr:universal stress protein [Roseovarius marisflavi]SHL26145.1 Nucleotide-binding universal stress protein, UspA family [Roseovarius marisflavi]
MYKKIIVSLSLDHGISEPALEAAQKLLDEGGEIIAIHIHEPLNPSVRSYVDEDTVNAALEAAKGRLAKRVANFPGVGTRLITGHSGRAITDFAREWGADCIVIGSHKPGISDFLLGSTAARVVRHAPCSVHVLR